MKTFKQIVTGVYQTNDKKTQHSVYALGADGQVYKFFVNEGWVLMEARPARPTPSRSYQGTDEDAPF